MLNENGFYCPSFAELLDEQVTRAKELFGDDIDTSEGTALGKYIRLNCYDYAKCYETVESVYYARFPNYADGQSLDRLLPFAGMSRNPATAAIHTVEFYGTSLATIEAGELVGTDDGINFYTTAAVTLSDDGFGYGTGRVVVQCTEAGSIGNVPVGAITKMVNPNAYVQTVTHIDTVILGKDTETDYAVRLRFADTIKGIGTGTYEAIYGALSRVTNVDGVVIVENDTAETVDGLPPHSFHVYVVAPESADQDIADTLFAKKPVGIKCLGEVAVDVLDNGGMAHTMRFSRATQVDMAVRITVGVNALFPSDGADQIKQNIYSYINGLKNGGDVVYTKFFGYIHSVTGVEETASLQVSSDNGSTYGTSNVVIAPNQFARITLDKIEVEVENYVDQ